MNYIETCTKIAVFLWRSSNYRPLTSVLHVRPGWIIYQNMRETWEKKVMKFEREIPIGLDARRKKQQGGAEKAPPPNGIRVNVEHWKYVINLWWSLSILPSSGKRWQVTCHLSLSYWCLNILPSVLFFQAKFHASTLYYFKRYVK